jgi:hypothetical protein
MTGIILTAGRGGWRPLHAVDYRGFPSIEIDFPNDSWRGCPPIAPALDDAIPGGGALVGRAADHV